MKHNCRAEGCPAQIPTTQLMCKEHWRLVPMHLKGRVLDAYSAYRYAASRSASEAVAAGKTLRAAQQAAVAAVGFVRAG